MGKPFYPAKWFKRRFNYPPRFCQRCGARLVPKIKTSGNGYDYLEVAHVFRGRKYCGLRKSDCVGRMSDTFPLQPSKPSLGRIDEETREMLAQALNNHPEMREVWPEVVG